ncbi:hypothetical protein Cgig2_024411 [Carnegiea gigantea]|uniref:Uncharacterized protein n=1 Tax=Carnegiea gigantea TaxID=171969 RepID=A0A9Q1KKE2_9CARY|nr:hypothetical protein Cgig2_024411 [Carnegiea gigantea]
MRSKKREDRGEREARMQEGGRLHVHGKPILFQCSEASSEVEKLLKGTMDDYVSRERGKRRTLQKDMQMSNNTRDKVGIFTKLYTLLVVSGLLFPRCTGGVAWDLISMVEDVKSIAEYNWAEATWMFLMKAIEEVRDDGWVHLYKGKKYDTRLVVAAIYDNQVGTLTTEASVVFEEINVVLEVREEERVKDVVRAFIDTDEYKGYVEDAEAVISLEVRLRRVRDVLRKEKEAHAATKKELAATKKKLAELRAMIQAGDGKANVDGEEVQAGDERVVEPRDDSVSLIHHSEADDGVVRLSPHVGSAEAIHEEGKLEACDASLGDTELRSDDVQSMMDVGHGTSDDVLVGESALEVVVLGSPAAGSERRDTTSAGRIGRIAHQWYPSPLQSSHYLNPDRAVGKGKRKCAKFYTSRKRSRKEGQHEGEIEGVIMKAIHGKVLGNAEGGEPDGGLGKLLQLAMLSIKVREEDVGVGHTHSPVAVGSSYNDQGSPMTKRNAEMISLGSNIYEASEEELNPDAIVRVGPTVVEGVERNVVDVVEVTTSRMETCMDEQAI